MELRGTTVCPTCGGDVERTERDQPALFIHADYGATERTIVLSCTVCDWFLETERQATAP